MIPIAGRQIRLRDWRVEDEAAYLRAFAPDQPWQKLDGPYYGTPSLASQQGLVAKLRDRVSTGDWPEPRQRLMIADRTNDAFLGTVTRYWISQETNWPAVGIVIYDEQNWGRGLGFEALGLWSDYLWGALPAIVRLDLRTWSGNLGMMALARNLGYQEEARFRRARIVAGDYYDSVGFGVLREEWSAQYPAGFAHHLMTNQPK